MSPLQLVMQSGFCLGIPEILEGKVVEKCVCVCVGGGGGGGGGGVSLPLLLCQLK